MINSKDNVATALINLESNTYIKDFDLKVLQDIPLGHKIALKNISKNSHIIKYGEIIGKASKDILKGELVHIHNIEGIRGRGDL